MLTDMDNFNKKLKTQGTYLRCFKVSGVLQMVCWALFEHYSSLPTLNTCASSIVNLI